MKVNIKRLNENAVIPTYAKQGDAGMDLIATSKEYDDNGNVVYGTGLAFEIPEGYVGLLFPRSSNAKTNLILSNSVGVLDSGYRGEVMFKFKSTVRTIANLFEAGRLGDDSKCGIVNNFVDSYEINDRIGQIIIMPYPKVEFNLVSELSETERGEGGYGSTGK